MRFLLGVATLAVVATLVGCGSSSDEATTAVDAADPPAASSSPGAGDLDAEGAEKGSTADSKVSGDGSKGKKGAGSDAATGRPARDANAGEGKSGATRDPAAQLPEPPDVPLSSAEVRKKMEEVEALNQRLLDPPPGKTTQEVVEEVREEFEPNR